MDHKDDSIEEILKRLRSINNRLDSIEELLEAGKEGEVSEKKLPKEKEEVSYPVREEEEQKSFVYEKAKGSTKTDESTKAKAVAVTAADQERLWINILHKIGIVALIIGVGLFIKYAFPFIGLWGRIAIGLFIGTALLYTGEKLMKGYGPYALGISS